METENNSDLEIESSHIDPADNPNPVDTPFPHSISLSPNDIIIEIFQSLENDCYLDPEAYGNYDGDLLNLLFITSLQGKEPEQVKAELEEQNTSFEVVCGRFIKEKEVFFRCLDCDLLKQKNNYVYALLCTHCFEDSDHKGHRILYEQAEAGGSAICDCGDPYSFKEEGFCNKHKDIKIDPQTVLGRFPKEILEDVTTNLRKAFYGIVSVYELAVKFSKGDINQRNHFHHLGRVMFQDLIGFCEMLHTELSSGFLLVLGDVFRSGFLQDFSMVWHDCEDYNNDNNDWSLDHKQPHPCKCTILDNLFRIGAVLDEESQGSVQKLLLECAKDRSFKIHTLHRFVKYMPYMYNQDYKNSLGKTMCRLVNMKVQLYGDEELCAEALKSEYFGNHLHILKRAITGASELSNELYNICMDINMALGYCLVERYSIGPAVVEKLNLIEEIFGVLKTFQNKFPYSKEIRFGVFAHEVDYNSLNFGLMVTRTLTDILENSFAVFFKLEDQQKIHYIQRTLELWRSNFEEAKQVTEENLAKGVVSFNCIFERSFAFLVSYTTKEANRVKFQEFQNRFFPGMNAETLAERSSKELIKTFGKIRYLHLIHNFSFGELYSVYYFKNNLYFESDISFIQRICQQLDRKGAYDFLVRNYFNYCPEIVKFLRHPASESIPDDRFREKLLTVEDFLDFLIFIMTDEICYLNVLFGEKDAHYKGEKLSIRGEKIFKKLLISILAGYYWVDGNTVKEDLKQYLFVNEKEFNMNKIYSEIVLVDKKNKKVRVKDELVNAKFTKFVTLYHRVFQIFGQWARTQTFYQDKYSLVLQRFSRVESSSLIDEMVLCEILFDLLTVSNPEVNKELSVNQLIIEYFIYKVIRQKALTLPEGDLSLQVIKNLTDQDWERGEIQPYLTKLTKKMQVVKLLVQESSSKLTETNILDCFDMIHNNDILAFQVKDYINLCKETIAGDKLSQDIVAIVPKMDILKKIESQEMVKKLLKLPKSFQDYNDIYTKKKCSLCGKFSKHLMTSLCLICGDTICQGTCSDMSTELGNLNAHSIQFHAGSCSFMSIQNPFWVIVSAPDTWISGYKDLYTNFLGESVANKIEDAANLYDMEFGDFQLNQEIESQVTEVVLEDSNRRVMYNSAQKEGYYFNNFEV